MLLLDRYGFGQVAGLVYVAAAADSDVIRQELQRNNFEQWGEELRGRRYLDDVIGGFAGEIVSLGDHRNYDAVAGFDFLDVGDAFFVACDRVGIGGVVSRQHDHRQILVDQGVGSVLHFAGGIAFGVNVGDFFEFERAFESDGVMNTAAEVKEIRVAKKLPGQSLTVTGLFGLENHFDFVGDASELLQERLGRFAGEFAAQLSEMRREQQQRGQLGGKTG